MWQPRVEASGSTCAAELDRQLPFLDAHDVPVLVRIIDLSHHRKARLFEHAAALGALEVVQRNALYRDLGVADPLTPLELSLVTIWVALLGVSTLAAAAWSVRRAFGLAKPA